MKTLTHTNNDKTNSAHPAGDPANILPAVARAQATIRAAVVGPAAAKPMTAREGLTEMTDWALRNRFCSTAGTLRELLLSLYSGDNKCDLSNVQLLDTHQRRWLVALLTGIGRDGGVYDHEIRETFAILGGESGLRWFFEPTGGIDDDLVRHFMGGVRRKAVAK